MPDNTPSRKEKLTGLMKKLYMNPKTRGMMAGVPAALAATSNPALLAAGASVSVFDAFLVAQLSQLESNRERLAERTDRRMEVLYDEGCFDERIFEDPDFKGLVFQAAMAAAQETSDEKIDLIAAVLAGAASKDKPPQMNMRAILSSISFLTIEEIRLARQFYDGVPEIQTFTVIGTTTPQWGAETDFYLKRLETANLVVPMMQPGVYPSAVQQGQYVVTSTFRRLMELVKQTEPPGAS